MAVLQKILLFSLYLISVLFLETGAIVPFACRTNLTGICCPDDCNSRFNRGICAPVRPVSDRRGTPDNYYRRDDRLRWPRGIFSRLCRCRYPFSGVACDLCVPGRSGLNCNVRSRTHRIRRNILTMSRADVENFNRVMNASLTFPASQLIFDERQPRFFDPLTRDAPLRNVSVQEYMVFLHRYPSRPVLRDNTQGGRTCQQTDDLDLNHNGRGFLSWHRLFMHVWEEELLRVADRLGVNNFALPYWDWTNATSCQICNNTYIGSANTSGHISNASVYSNFVEWCPFNQTCQTGCVVGDLSYSIRKVIRNFNPALPFPTTNDVRRILRLRRYSTVWGDYIPTFRTCRDFASALEGVCPLRRRRQMNWDDPVDTFMHNRVHAIFRGSFSDTITSPNDPMFIFHHTQIDRLLEKWLRIRRRTRRSRRRRRRRPSNRRRARRLYARRIGRPVRMDLIGHCGLCYTVGFIPVIRNVELLNNVRRLGYDYDSYRFGTIP